jgi:hypothetical protein
MTKSGESPGPELTAILEGMPAGLTYSVYAHPNARVSVNRETSRPVDPEKPSPGLLVSRFPGLPVYWSPGFPVSRPTSCQTCRPERHPGR